MKSPLDENPSESSVYLVISVIQVGFSGHPILLLRLNLSGLRCGSIKTSLERWKRVLLVHLSILVKEHCSHRLTDKSLLDLTCNLGREQGGKPELSLSTNLAVTEVITATTLGIY